MIFEKTEQIAESILKNIEEISKICTYYEIKSAYELIIIISNYNVLINYFTKQK